MVYKLFNGEELINTIVASPAFVDAYCAEMGYTYEEVPVSDADTKSGATADDVLNVLLGVSE